MKHDAAILADAYSKRTPKKYDSLYLPRAHEDIVLIRVTGHAPNKVLSAPSVLGNRVHDVNTNTVLGVRLNWSVAFHPVRGIACQVILEDCIVCTTAKTGFRMTRYVKVMRVRIDVLICRGECNREHIRLLQDDISM